MENIQDNVSDGLQSLSNTLQCDFAIERDNICVNSSPIIELPWGELNTDIEVLDVKNEGNTILVLGSIKGDLGIFYSYSTITETSNIAIIDLSKVDDCAFDENKSVLEEFQTFHSSFKKCWTRDISEDKWRELST